ncbi:MAG: urate hydroxylase PuuD [Telmatospirillum sp.]|nr:urate hydroxylase PuuD [Telmatospirillum sp.]
MLQLLPEWLDMIVRWTHVITGIAWIGSSFYFNWLESKFRAPEVPRDRVEGETWLVHGGGFYRVEKFAVAPPTLPAELHWFKWEAAFTWISGVLLLSLVYYVGSGGSFLTHPFFAQFGTLGAAVFSLGVIAFCWILYDQMWKTAWAEGNSFAATVATFLGFVLLAYLLTRVMAPHAAYIHVGAVIGTIMTANVWLIILPNQRELVDSTREGRTPQYRFANQAKFRSLHNNYFTLPIIFIMLSKNYGSTWGHEWNWALLAGLACVGASVRHVFNLRNKGRGDAGFWIMPAAAVGMVGLFYVAAKM